MITPQTWKHVEKLVEERAPKNLRFRRLRGKEAKPAVIAGATARLFEVDALLPNPLRMRLNPRRVGNITLRNVDPLAWLAWVQVWRGHVESGEFWYEELDAAKQKLIDLAVDAELKAYKNATSYVGGNSKPVKSDKLFELGRYTEEGQANARTPERELEKKERFDAYEAALEQREKQKEEERARVVPMLQGYADQLDEKQKYAWRLICNEIYNEPRLEGKEISKLSGVSEPTVTRRRKWFVVMSKRYFELCQPLEDNAPADAESDPTLNVTAFEAAPDAVFDDELEPLGAAEVDRQGDTAPLDAAALTLSPVQGDADGDCSENVLRGHARTRAAERAQHGGPGRPTISDAAMDRGYENYKYKDKDKERKHRVCAWHVRGVKQEKSKKRYANTAARYLQKKAAEAGFDIEGAKRLIDEYIEQRIKELEIAEAEVALWRVLFMSSVLQDVEGLAWVAPRCREWRASPNDLFGTTGLRMSTDESLGASIAGPAEGDQ